MTVSIRFLRIAGLCALLAACGRGEEAKDDLNALDARLTNNGASNGTVLEARTDAEREAQAAAGGRIEAAPAAIESNGSATLAEIARRQAAGGTPVTPRAAAAGGACANGIQQGGDWVERMPAPFRPYPRAQLTEAAGNQSGECRLRVVSFTTDAPLDRVLGYYYTQAKRAGYDAEHLLVQGEHQLGGTKGDLAYVVFARQSANNRTDVDIVANVE